ncbi:MAG: nitroreductase [Candidatus Altiarchaeales archaeon ex4484_43]|nr:MAG: nitroreductase [Candidatus Altiarchaeales archaeon ex4484_43]RLI89442.1 MAG: nitroreductase family protein [Candidatus Altiarchaeales archaeon]
MDILDIIKNRRSIRHFSPRDVESDKIDKILEAAKWAPSAGNLQARDLILIKDPKTRDKIATAALNQGFISEAPIVIVVCANRRRSGYRYGRRGELLYCIQDATASIQNMLLMAHSMGLGSCWVGAFDGEKVREILGIPPEVSPVAIIPIGYPDEIPVTPERRIEVHENRW